MCTKEIVSKIYLEKTSKLSFTLHSFIEKELEVYYSNLLVSEKVTLFIFTIFQHFCREIPMRSFFLVT